jgi:hypothetical protein
MMLLNSSSKIIDTDSRLAGITPVTLEMLTLSLAVVRAAVDPRPSFNKRSTCREFAGWMASRGRGNDVALSER